MRTVLVFSAAPTEVLVACLDAIDPEAGESGCWIVADRLWVSIASPPDWWDGFEDERAAIEREIGTSLSLVSADVSAHIDGHDEARAFALTILSLAAGLAFDDYALRAWTLDEIESDDAIDGQRFFPGRER
ncbi:MAG: hypothetical protein AAB131_17150 [Actinomycetota bacterium]